MQLWLAHENDATRVLPEETQSRAVDMLANYDVLLLSEGGRPVVYTAIKDNGDHVFIRHFVVDDAARGRGIGRAAFQHLASHRFAGRSFRLDASVKVPGPRAFWETLGFRPRAWAMERRAA